MGAHTEAIGNIGLYAAAAPGNVKDTLALVATEVVMVVQVGTLVASGLTGQFDRSDHALLGECLDAAVDRGDVDAGDRFLGQRDQLGGEQGPPAFADGGFDGVSLLGLSFHDDAPDWTWRTLLLMIPRSH
jgi:hypothetical protein